MLYDIAEIKEKNKVMDVARDLGQNLEGPWMQCTNPRCRQVSKGRPSVKIDEIKNRFECKVCHEIKGDVIDFYRWCKQTGTSEAIKFLAQRAGIKPANSESHQYKEKPFIDFKKIIEVNNFLLGICSDIPRKCQEWLEEHNISLDTAKNQRLGFISDYAAVTDELKRNFPVEILKQSGLFNKKGNLRYFKQRLLIPYLKRGEPVYMQAKSIDGRNSPQEAYPSRPVPCPYNIDCAFSKKPRIFICNGVIDTITLISQGLEAIGIPKDRGFNNKWLPAFKERTITVVFGGDHINRLNARKLVQLLNDHGAKADAIDLPQGVDVNGFFMVYSCFFNQKRF